jgi:hypothetical protein
MVTGARKVAEKSAGTSGAFTDVAAKLKTYFTLLYIQTPATQRTGARITTLKSAK